ncbi:hypothetical protein, partial [Catenulispora pinisilvae]|uniref:hypothetical protein n=1 Tax=Catenulispora pinisilvae TaxID=2705253 RepID=UPI00189111E3
MTDLTDLADLADLADLTDLTVGPRGRHGNATDTPALTRTVTDIYGPALGYRARIARIPRLASLGVDPARRARP